MNGGAGVALAKFSRDCRITNGKVTLRHLPRRVIARPPAATVIPRRLGKHSMSKTRGYMMHSAGVPIEKIAAMLNHSTPAITMKYIGLEQEDIAQTYHDFEL